LINFIGDRSAIRGGEGTVRFSPDANTTIEVRVDAEGPSPRALAKIINRLDLEDFDRETDLRNLIDCPLPFGRPGARMFTQSQLGIDVGVSGPNVQGIEEIAVSYIESPQGVDYCSTLPPTVGIGKLRVPFRFMGASRSTFYTHDTWVGFSGPQVFNITPFRPPVVDAPCTHQDALINPNVVGTNIDMKDAITLEGDPGNSGGCQNLFPVTKLIEGMYIARPPGVFNDKRITNKSETGPWEGAQIISNISNSPANLSASVPQRYAVINFTLEGGSTEQEFEIVLLYPSGRCNGAVGLFYGGPDGLRPWSYKQWQGTDFFDTSTQQGDQDHYMAPQFCPFTNLNVAHTPFLRGGYLVGNQGEGRAWIQGDGTVGIAGNPGARDGLNSRAFWFRLDGNGYPSRDLGGLAQGPLVVGPDEQATSIPEDLAWSN
jgi:hypothetical protein